MPILDHSSSCKFLFGELSVWRWSRWCDWGFNWCVAKRKDGYRRFSATFKSKHSPSREKERGLTKRVTIMWSSHGLRAYITCTACCRHVVSMQPRYQMRTKRKERQKLTSTFQSYLCRMIEQFGGIKKIRKRMKIIFFISQTMDVKDM